MDGLIVVGTLVVLTDGDLVGFVDGEHEGLQVVGVIEGTKDGDAVDDADGEDVGIVVDADDGEDVDG